jgi:hypothetical protein
MILTLKSINTRECCILNYLYRDAGNYKKRGRITVSGALSIRDLESYLYESEFFLPELVGLPSLTPKMKSNDDHPWHELDDVTRVSNDKSLMSAVELIARFKFQNSSTWGQWTPAVPLTTGARLKSPTLRS